MKRTISLVLVLALGLAVEVANADFTFGTPTNLGPTVNGSAHDWGAEISADGLSLFFHSFRPGGSGVTDLWVTKRPTKDHPWEEPVNLGPTVNSSSEERGPSISSDGLELYFHSNRPGGYGGWDIWVTTRATTSNSWGPPVNLGPTVNSSSGERGPNISADGLTLFLHSERPGGVGGADIWVTTRPTKNADWGTPVHLGSTVNSSYNERQPTISDDGLWLFFFSERPGGSGGDDIWFTTRATTDDDWGTPVNLGSTVNSSAHDFHPDISGDGSTLYFGSTRPGGVGGDDIWQVSIFPIVDLNGDGIVDSADMCIMVDYWHTDEPSCDIGPTPFGDGIVDVQDLIVLAEHLFTYPGTVAYWKLDETEGDIATDSAGQHDGTLHREPLWQPTAGAVDGALQFDGVDDYVSTDFVLNPADGKFSVFVWIKGVAPGQAVVSQAGGANWLCTDSLDGKLMTELKGTGRGAAALLSQTIITDDEWHRIGFVWDGAYRALYVDDVEVAKDAQDGLKSATGVLYIGTGTAMEAVTYWSGLIDDVRIYNRAVKP